MPGNYIPYVYLIGWSTLGKWYYGCRTAKKSSCLYKSGCNPDELMKTYFTSSKYVKAFIKSNGLPDIIKIRKTFKNPKRARRWESRVIIKLKLYENPAWLNKGNSMGSYVMDGEVEERRIARCRKVLTGKKRSKEIGKKISDSKRGKSFSDSHKLALSKASQKVRNPLSDATKTKISVANSGKKRSLETRSLISNVQLGKRKWPGGRPIEQIQKIKDTWANKEELECPHCGIKSTSASCLYRWHFQNCKKNESRQN